MARSDYFQDRSDYDFLEPRDVRNGQVLTIKEFEESHTSLGTKPCIRFIELPEKILTLNATNYDWLVSQYGPDEYGWRDKLIAISIEQVPNPRDTDSRGNPRKQAGIRFKKVPGQAGATNAGAL